MQTISAPSNWAIVTPSYRGDYERCQLLCESIDALVTGPWHHYIIVERIDVEMFRTLEGPRRTLVEKQSLLPKWLHYLLSIRIGRPHNIWFGFRTGFIGGWQIQQLVKMEMAFRLQEAGMLFCDSDMFFLKPFDVSSLASKGAFRFYCTKNVSLDSSSSANRFPRVAAKTLGLSVQSPYPHDYINNMVTWHTPTAREMCDYISNISGSDWKAVVSRQKIYSEYTLYGVYVDHIAKNKDLFAVTERSLCHTAWGEAHLTDRNLDEFCAALKPHEVAVGFQSFMGVSVDDLRSQLKRAVKQLTESGSALNSAVL